MWEAVLTSVPSADRRADLALRRTGNWLMAEPHGVPLWKERCIKQTSELSNPVLLAIASLFLILIYHLQMRQMTELCWGQPTSTVPLTVLASSDRFLRCARAILVTKSDSR